MLLIVNRLFKLIIKLYDVVMAKSIQSKHILRVSTNKFKKVRKPES